MTTQVNPAVRSTVWTWLLPLLIAVVAFAARYVSVASVGGLGALLGYDEGVYMGAATALVHGLVPYRDFTLVHPPGSTVLLSPFALLGRVTSEPTGWAAARVFVMALGAVNAAMVTIVARRVSMVAAVTAGLLYALWAPVVHVERTTMLEAFVLTALLVALVVLRHPRTSLMRAAIAGGALGVGMSVKLWGAVPILVIVGWLMVNRAWRQAMTVALCAALAFALVVAPFLAVTGQRMIDLVVFAQLGRGDGGTTVVDRPARMLAMDASPHVSAVPSHLVWAVVVVIAVLGALAAWRRPEARLWVGLLVTQAGVLLAVPVYFAGYSSFIGPALALVVGAGVDVLVRSPRSRVVRGVAAAGTIAAGVALLAGSVARMVDDGDSIRGADPRVAAAVAGARCVASDSTGVLLLYDALGRSIDAGCGHPLIDVDGTVYAVRQDNPGHLTSSARRRSSAAYQEELQRYFATGDVVLVHRAAADVLDPATVDLLTRKGMSLEARGLRVFGGAS